MKNNILSLAVILSATALLCACQPYGKPLSAKQQAAQKASQAGTPNVHTIIDAQNSAQNKTFNEVGINFAKNSEGVFEVEATAPQGTVLSAAHDMFQKKAYEVCGGDNYTYSITKQENTSFYDFVGIEKKLVHMPVVKGNVFCNTRNKESQLDNSVITNNELNVAVATIPVP